MSRAVIMSMGLVATIYAGAASALVVTPTTLGTDFTSTIEGPGITTDLGSISYIGAGTQGGTFTDGLSSGLGIESGIILTSGDATGAPGPNSDPGFTGSLGTSGDSDLSGLIGGTTTFDANILEFDFTTTTGNLFFNFVFASEEYNEFLGFIDAFGLFVDGINFALAPDGSPVSVGTVNCGASGTDPSGPNCASFNNNDTGVFDLEYDGFTDVFTASILGLSSGTHTMKFGIADASDTALDSAVFIEANSFAATDPSTPVPAPSTLVLFGMGLIGLHRLRRKMRA